MDIKSLIAAYLISQGAHTGGHFYQANNPDMPMNDVPMRLDAKNLMERWQVPDKWGPEKKGDPYASIHQSHKDYLADNNRKAGAIHGAGFAMQDLMRDAVDDPELRKQVAGMNAFMEALYLAGVPMKLSQQLKSGGDLKGMEKTSGNKHVNALVTASMLNNLYQSQKKDSGNAFQMGFTTVDGAPGLKFTYKF